MSWITQNPPTADEARRILQNVENLFNQALVDRVFEDLSIPAAKIVGAVAPAAHAATHSDGGSDEIQVENLATAVVDPTQALFADGAGGLAFGAVAGGAINYDGTYTNSLVSTNASVSGYYAIGIGYGANGGYTDAIAIGHNASATVPNSIAIGESIVVSGAGTVVIGTTPGPISGTFTGTSCVSVGGQGHAFNNCVNIGYLSNVTGNLATAVGYNASAAAYGASFGQSAQSAANGTALGRGAWATGTASLAVGHFANATAANNIAIGQGVQNAVANSLKMGWANTSGNYIQFADFSPTAGAYAGTHYINVTLGGSVYKLLLAN